MQVVAAALLIPLKKKDGGIRPAAVGEVIRCLTSKILATSELMWEVSQSLSPLQMGVGFQGAYELFAKGLSNIC